MTKPDLESLLKNSGFDLVGIAPYQKLTEERVALEKWTERGMAADMEYMKRNFDKKEDPALVVPGCKSIIVVGMNYFTRRHAPAEKGKISKYAWGGDYHDVMLERLYRICDAIKTDFPGSSSRAYVDFGPTMDRRWAVRAGLGWQAKNGCIISPEIGSFFFIGLIITTVDFADATPGRIPDGCGSCARCMKACPTGAIVSPTVVDARKCLSYWTIEYKGESLPDEIADKQSGNLFGCDICQDVCPWNIKLEIPTAEQAFLPRNDQSSIAPVEVIEMTQGDFNARFRKSPVKRTKLAGLKRNAESLLRFNK
ncbi:MAG: tRNA epoxyqueuosine(34) reductase QueG [Chloroflexota bacterium]